MKDTTLRAVQFVNILLFALVMGVFWGTWFSLSRSIASIRPETFLEIGHTMIANLGGPMSMLMPAALLSSLLAIVMLWRRRYAGAGAGALSLAIAGLALMIAALVITLSVNVPIDVEIQQWTVSTLPADWTAIRDRWELFHAMRTGASIGAFASAVASALR